MPAPRRRLHRVASEEDASQLKLGIYLWKSMLWGKIGREEWFLQRGWFVKGRLTLGHEFNDADTLTTSEAKLLIDVVLTKRPKDTGEEMPITE